MLLLSWGKCRLVYGETNESGAVTKWNEFPTPIENTTNLNTEKGDKTEAKIEGGENEAVKYGRSTYNLTFDIRIGKGRKIPIKDDDGIIKGEWKVALQPEESDAVAIMIDRSTISVETKYASADGITLTYTVDALKPADNTQQVKLGTVSIASGTNQPTFTAYTDTNYEVIPTGAATDED